MRYRGIKYVLASLLLLVSSLSYGYDWEIDGIYYSKDPVIGVNVVGINSDVINEELVIPSSVVINSTEYKVSIFSEAFNGNNKVKRVVVSDGVTIGSSSFANCQNLETVRIKNGAKIGDGAFGDCTSLSTVIIDQGVTEIGSGVFSACVLLDSISIPNGVTKLSDHLFDGCMSLVSVSIPEGVTSIGEYAFFGCLSLRNISIPQNVTYIGGGAFICCAIDSITIPSGVEAINYQTFSYCNKLETVIIQNGVHSINKCAFEECTSLKKVILPSSVEQIYLNAFYNDANLSLNIPASVKYIGENALYGVTASFESAQPIALESANLLGTGVAIVSPEAYDSYCAADYWKSFKIKIVKSDQITSSVTATASPNASGLHLAVGEDNLNNVLYLTVKGSINGKDLLVIRNKMRNLQTLDLSEADIVANDDMFDYYEGGCIKSDNKLGAYAFKDIANIRSIILPNSLVEIGEKAFQNCTQLYTVFIPDNVKIIGDNAFSNCKKLSVLHMSANVKEIGASAFEGCRFPSVILGDSLQTLGVAAFSNNECLANVSFGNGLEVIDQSAFSSCIALKQLIIPDCVKQIKSRAFIYCSFLETVIIGNGVELIGDAAFEECFNITNISFGKSLKEIGTAAFIRCSSIQTISLPTSLKYIQGSAFAYCTGLKEFRIPSSVEMIGPNAFTGNDQMEAVYAYTIEPISISQNTFSCWDYATLYVPKTSYYTYYLNTQWSQFMTLREFDEPYEYFYLNNDYYLDATTGRIEGEPDMLLNENSAILVEGNETQEISEIELVHNGVNGGSIIGGKNDFSGSIENLTAKSMKVRIGIEGSRWYFFCFPFEVYKDSMECSTDYALYYYDGNKRSKGETGWTRLEQDFGSLQKGVGYIFQASRSGVLTIHVGTDYLTFSAQNEREALNSYTSNNAADAHWNFVGNPFISYYDIQDLAQVYDAPIIVWNGRGYDVYKPGDDEYMMKPFEGGLTQKTEDYLFMDFISDNRLTFNQAETRSAQYAARRAQMGTPINLDRQLVNIVLMGQDSITDRTRIVYSVNASMDYEIGVDAAKFQADGVPQLYTLNGKTKYAINERPMGSDEIKLGYTVPKAGTYTLSVPRHDAEVEIYDNVAKSKVDFTFGDYSFQTQAGTFNDRFVVYKTGDGATKVENGFRLDGMTVTAFDGGIEIEGQLKGKVQIYSESGMLMAEPIQTGRVKLDGGVYIIKIGDKSIKLNI